MWLGSSHRFIRKRPVVRKGLNPKKLPCACLRVPVQLSQPQNLQGKCPPPKCPVACAPEKSVACAPHRVPSPHTHVPVPMSPFCCWCVSDLSALRIERYQGCYSLWRSRWCSAQGMLWTWATGQELPRPKTPMAHACHIYSMTMAIECSSSLIAACGAVSLKG